MSRVHSHTHNSTQAIRQRGVQTETKKQTLCRMSLSKAQMTTNDLHTKGSSVAIALQCDRDHWRGCVNTDTGLPSEKHTCRSHHSRIKWTRVVGSALALADVVALADVAALADVGMLPSSAKVSCVRKYEVIATPLTQATIKSLRCASNTARACCSSCSCSNTMSS